MLKELCICDTDEDAELGACNVIWIEFIDERFFWNGRGFRWGLVLQGSYLLITSLSPHPSHRLLHFDNIGFFFLALEIGLSIDELGIF